MSEGRYSKELMAHASWLYHEEGMTGEEIGRVIRVSRQTVGRILQEAQRAGIVRTFVDTRYLPSKGLADLLAHRYRLAAAVVVPPVSGSGALNDRLAKAAADVLMRSMIRPGVSVAIGWGQVVLKTLLALDATAVRGVQFVSAAGGIDSYIAELARKESNGVSRVLELIQAPLRVSTAAVAETLRQEPVVEGALRRARECDVLLTGIGSAEPGSRLESLGLYTAEEFSWAREQGAVGDMLGEWFTSTGAPLSEPSAGRKVGLPISELKRMNRVVGVAGGPDKVAAIRGALVGGFLGTLVTDEDTAQALIT
ncbi:MAG: sugar-binding transcriptional regulator [Propioniciclava sp.]